MKKWLAFLTIALSVNCLGGQILWTGLDDTAVIDNGIARVNISDWINTLSCTPDNVAARISIDGMYMRVGYEDPSGYIPPGQSAPTIMFDSPEWGEQYDYGILVCDDNLEPYIPYWYADYNTIEIVGDNMNAPVVYELGYWDENLGWDFVPLAYAQDTLGNLWNAHTYENGTLAPPLQTPWSPSVFYTNVPEPSCGILAILGMALLIRRRT